MAYPARAYHMYLCPFEEFMSKRFTESLIFRWSKLRTKAKSMAGIACHKNMTRTKLANIAEGKISSNRKAISL